MNNLINRNKGMDKMQFLALLRDNISAVSLFEFLKRYELFTIAIGLLFLMFTSGIVIKASFKMARITSPMIDDDQENCQEDRLYGKVFGKCENIIIFLLVLFNGYTALALIFTGKTIVRNRDKERISVYHLAGTMINTAYSILVAALFKYLISKSGSLV
jgi:hypothetical protein